MKKRRKFTREFKISVIRELENGKSSAQAGREQSVSPSVQSKWKQEYKWTVPPIAHTKLSNFIRPLAY